MRLAFEYKITDKLAKWKPKLWSEVSNRTRRVDIICGHVNRVQSLNLRWFDDFS